MCADRAVLVGYNDLATTDRKLLLEWDYELNKILPTQVYNPFRKVCSLYLYTFIMGFGLPVDFQASDEYNKY